MVAIALTLIHHDQRLQSNIIIRVLMCPSVHVLTNSPYPYITILVINESRKEYARMKTAQRTRLDLLIHSLVERLHLTEPG